MDHKELLGLNKIEYQEISMGVIYTKSITALMSRYYKLTHLLGYSSIQMFKATFGRQKTCKNYTNRCWIWTFCKNDIIIYALVSTEGPSWESPTPTDPETQKFLEEILADMTRRLKGKQS